MMGLPFSSFSTCLFGCQLVVLRFRKREKRTYSCIFPKIRAMIPITALATCFGFMFIPIVPTAESIALTATIDRCGVIRGIKSWKRRFRSAC